MVTAPQMHQFLEYYDHSVIHPFGRLDEPSKILLLQLFEEASPIATDEQGHRRNFYFYLPKGSFEDYKKLHDADEATLKEWFDREEDGWFDCLLIQDDFGNKDDPYYAVMINHAYVLCIGDRNEVEWPETDAVEFLHVLMDIVHDTVAKLKDGTYNDWIRKNLAYYMRVGKVTRADYWKAFPEEKLKYTVTQHERDILMQENANTHVPKTAREYYEAVAVCYRAIGLEENECFRFRDSEEEHKRYGGMTPKELYYRYADGRDDDLSEVNLDSEEEFGKWLRHEAPYTSWGGHPFEIVFSFTGEHSIHLYLMDDKLYLSGGKFPANMTALKMYVALVDHGYAVEFGNREAILLRIEEKDYIGLKPWFQYNPFEDDPDEIIDMIELDVNSYAKLKDKIIWASIPEVKLQV